VRVIDGSEHVMGRLATYVAKQVLDGEDVVVLNADKLVITGRKEDVLKGYKHKRSLGVTGQRRKGPYFPRMPDRIFRRTVRGMIPYQKPRGRTAYRRLKVFVGVPDSMRGAKATRIPQAMDRGSTRKVYLGEISRMLGAKF
jgi:large subunit ribosomal protein L13